MEEEDSKKPEENKDNQNEIKKETYEEEKDIKKSNNLFEKKE